MTDRIDGSYRIVLLAVLVEGGLAIVALGLGVLLKQPPLIDARWNALGIIIGTVASIPMIALFLVLFRWPIGPLADLRNFVQEFVPRLFARCTLAEIALISLLAGIGEEMLFRGVVQAFLSHRLQSAIALIVASLLFGVFHAVSLTYAVVASLMGAYLGGVWLVSGNLLAPIICHAIYDFVILVYLLRIGVETQR